MNHRYKKKAIRIFRGLLFSYIIGNCFLLQAYYRFADCCAALYFDTSR